VKINIVLSRLVRETKMVMVDVPDDWKSFNRIDQEDFCIDLYDQDDGTDFVPDEEWGCYEGTHTWYL